MCYGAESLACCEAKLAWCGKKLAPKCYTDYKACFALLINGLRGQSTILKTIREYVGRVQTKTESVHLVLNKLTINCRDIKEVTNILWPRL
jgi:hypothetical protein